MNLGNNHQWSFSGDSESLSKSSDDTVTGEELFKSLVERGMREDALEFQNWGTLSKAASQVLEELNKTKEYKNNNDEPPFQHGSVIHVKKAVTAEGKTRGYKIHEYTEDGKRIVHDNVNYQKHLDPAMARDRDNKAHGWLRRPGDRGRKDAPHFDRAEVQHGNRTSYGATGSRESKTMTLHPVGEPHTTHAKKPD